MADFEDEYEEEDETTITEEDCWTVIQSFFDSKGLVSQQLDSYDEFITSTINEIISETARIVIDQNTPYTEDNEDPVIKRRYELEFGTCSVSQPYITESDGSTRNMTPNEARIRNMTYSCPLYVDMKKKVSVARERRIGITYTDDGEEIVPEGDEGETELVWELETDPDEEASRVFIGRLPIMVKSKICQLRNMPESLLFAVNECPYDQGGYFIINGSEKVLIAQERSAANIVQVFKKKGSPTPFVAEIRSAVEKGSRLISSMQMKLFAKGESNKGGFGQTIKCTLPYIKSDIPIAIVFRALGMVSDEQILNTICDQGDSQMMEMLKPCLEEAFVIQDQQVALDYIGKRGQQMGTRDKRIRYARDIMLKEFLPHISQSQGSETKKAYFLGYMVNRLLQCALGRTEEDDRDHFGKKRLDLAGPLMAQVFRLKFAQLVREIRTSLTRTIEQGKEFQINLAVKQSIITNGLRYCLATGNWGDQKKAASAKAGVSQVLNRYTYASTLSHLRRTNTPIGRDGKIAKPRQLHNTHWGLVCPAETPEGQACGLVKNLALMCFVSVGQSDMGNLITYMNDRTMDLLEEYDPVSMPNVTKIFINGVWVGVTSQPQMLVSSIQQLRRTAIIGFETSLVWSVREREFKIFTDAGRVCRPLFRVDNNPRSPNRGHLVLNKEHVQKLRRDKDIDIT
ncbi:hypothetical protein LTR28_009083, partial [Elasticomyces elasticus]